MWLISYTGSEKSKTCMHRLKAHRKIWCENTNFEHDCYFIHYRGIRRTKNFTLAIIHENILREIERCNVYHPSLLPARWHEPRCLYRPTENSQTWMSHSVKGQTFQRIQRGNLVGSLGNHRWSQTERPSRGDPESKQRFIIFFNIMASHKMYKVSSKLFLEL